MKHPGKRLPSNSLGVCKIGGCGKRAVAFHLCSTHYSKLNKYGDPCAGRTNDGGADLRKKERREKAKQERTPKPVRQRAACSVSGCGDLAVRCGWCGFHYSRNRRHGDPLAGGLRKASPNSLGKCKVDGCELKARSLHLCSKHHSKLKKYGDPLGGYIQDGRSKKWNIRKGGYVIRFDRASPHAHPVSGIVFQHRQVIGEEIGRPLRSDEMVHHKNGNRSDNGRSNLELCIKRQPPGQRVEDQVKWAREILKEYGHLF